MGERNRQAIFGKAVEVKADTYIEWLRKVTTQTRPCCECSR
jgi:hypothetical protein